MMRNVRGTYDYLPKEQLIREEVIESLRNAFQVYGFSPIETSILCMQDILASKYAGGAEILKEVYTLSDQGGREIGLRYDLTVPFSKFISMNKNELPMPFKKYEIGKVFRDGPIKLGRKREFYQADVDVVGVKSFFGELEFFKLIDYVANKLGIKVVVKYNNRALLVNILKMLEVPEEQMNTIILTIDKFEKLSKEDIVKELLRKGLLMTNISILLNILSMSYLEILDNIDREENDVQEFIDFKETLELMNSKNTSYVFTPSLARGLEVYTGTIWEVFIDDEKSAITSSIGAGGRYDKIIGKFLDSEEEYPAVGMTFGVDVLMEIIKEKRELEYVAAIDYFLIPMRGRELATLDLANELRYKGLKVDVDLTGRKIKKSLNYANKIKVKYVSIIGEDEINNGIIKVKEMDTGIESEFGLRDFQEIANFILA